MKRFLGKIAVSVITILGLVWIVYSSLDLVSRKNQFASEYLFSKEDGRLLIINRINEINFDQIDFPIEPQIASVIQDLGTFQNEPTQLFISENRGHILIIAERNFDEKSIRKALHAPLDLSFTGLDNFKFDRFTGRFKKNRLYLTTDSYSLNEVPQEIPRFDVNASAVIATYQSEDVLLSEIYFDKKGKVTFKSFVQNSTYFKKVKDFDLFSHAIPSSITSYHFWETQNYAMTDSVFANGPMMKWVDKGFVEILYDGKRVIISDFIEGQDPIAVLNDYIQTPVNQGFITEFKKVKLMDDFPDGSILYVSMMDDFVILSSDPNSGKNIITDYKLGLTLSQHNSNISDGFKLLPQKVSERFLTQDEYSSKTLLQNQIVETAWLVHNEHNNNLVPTEGKTQSYDAGAPIQRFISLQGNGNFLVQNTNNELVFFKAGKKLWSKSFTTPIKGFQKINLSFNGTQQFLVWEKNNLHVFSDNGEELDGFPVQLDKDISSIPISYRWKNKAYILSITEDNSIIRIDAQGNQSGKIKDKTATSLAQLTIWSSNNTPYLGITGQNEFAMFDLNQLKEYRRFSIHEKAKPVKIPNELHHFYFDKDKLYAIDQKGKTYQRAHYKHGRILSVFGTIERQHLLIQSENLLYVVNLQGISEAEIKLPQKENYIAELHELKNQQQIISVVDDIENNVYLYKQNGERLLNKELEGSIQVQVDELTSGKLLISTVIDQFIVQYIENP